MARVRSPDRDKAFEIYKEHKGNIDLVRIAEILDIPAGTIRGWKNKDKWDNKLNGTFQKDNKKNTERSNKKNKTKKKPIVEEVEHVLNNTELTDKQRLFCIYHAKYFNATKAYQKAYDCDYITANTNGPRLLVNACIKKEIQKLKEGRLNRVMLEPEDIFQKYIDIAFSDISDFVAFGQRELPVLNPVTGEQTINDDGEAVTYTVNYVDFKESNTVDGTIISEVSKGKDGVKIKLQDKMKAMKWLADHMDLATEEQKLRIEKLKVEIENIKGNNKENETKSWVDAIQEIATKRRGKDG
ncbi:terminase small subunit [Clostridium botulinum]|uniref:terminase small subunit n=1 Tax=Clostridium botulinum TaxID=1491 RepID=UPI001D4924BB|nr:terminase small subunit [Clostridium botulinum]